jgi:hypothetical protein
MVWLNPLVLARMPRITLSYVWLPDVVKRVHIFLFFLSEA